MILQNFKRPIIADCHAFSRIQLTDRLKHKISIGDIQIERDKKDLIVVHKLFICTFYEKSLKIRCFLTSIKYQTKLLN